MAFSSLHGDPIKLICVECRILRLNNLERCVLQESESPHVINIKVHRQATFEPSFISENISLSLKCYLQFKYRILQNMKCRWRIPDIAVKHEVVV